MTLATTALALSIISIVITSFFIISLISHIKNHSISNKIPNSNINSSEIIRDHPDIEQLINNEASLQELPEHIIVVPHQNINNSIRTTSSQISEIITSTRTLTSDDFRNIVISEVDIIIPEPSTLNFTKEGELKKVTIVNRADVDIEIGFNNKWTEQLESPDIIRKSSRTFYLRYLGNNTGEIY